MMKKILMVILIFTCMSINAQEKRSIQLFLVRNIELKVVPYPWANELSLTLDILANSILKDGYVKVFVSYEGREAYTTSVAIKQISDENKYAIREIVEPLNGATSEALAGSYKVKIELLSKDQTPDFVSRWNKYFSEDKHKVAEKEFVLGTKEQIKKEEEKDKKFFIEKMKSLNNLLIKLEKHKVAASQARGNSKNIFAENGNFSKKKWWIWLNTEYLEIIKKEEKSLSIYSQQIFSLRYPYSLSAMQQYCTLLDRIGRKTTIDIYRYHRLEVDSYVTQGLDMFSIQNFKDLKYSIEKLHVNSAKELNISLFKELGYIPPPIK